MKKVDKINYDVVGAYRERREKQLEEELKKLKEEKEANKGDYHPNHAHSPGNIE